MSRDIRSTSKDSSLAYSGVKSIVKKRTRLTECIATTSTTKQRNFANVGKENCCAKKPEAEGSIVKQLKVRYEECSISCTNREIVNVTKNATSTGAIKKLKVSNNSTDPKRDKKLVAKKLPGVHHDEAFGKSRFKIYVDDSSKVLPQTSIAEKDEKKSNGKLENEGPNKFGPPPRLPIVDERFHKIRLTVRDENFQARVTPVDVLPVPSPAKKVKVAYRNSLSKSERAESPTANVARDSTYELPYDDCLIEYELEKEISVSKLSRNLRQQNITIGQRMIIMKFLTKLHTHLSLPSFILYQTVKLFDAVLDAKIVEAEDMQLIGLAAMWIAIKREHIAHDVPTAEDMLFYAGDIYEGKSDLLLKCEIDVLRTLNFHIVFPDPFSIMCYDITKCHRAQSANSPPIDRAYSCGCYMIDLSLLDEEIAKISVVLLAAAAAEAALYFTMEEVDANVEPSWYLWRTQHTAKSNVLVITSAEKSESMDPELMLFSTPFGSYSDGEIGRVRTILIRNVFESQKRHSPVGIVFEKYIHSRYGKKISHFLGNKVKLYLNEE